MKSFKINPCFFIVLLISILLGFYKDFILAFFTVLFHEAGHLMMIHQNKIEISYVKIEPFGVTVRLKNHFIKNPGEEIAVALSGPLFNFILALISFLIFKNKLGFFILSNLSMGLFNLLPAYPLDGGRILRACLSEKMGYLRSYRLVIITTRIISVLLIILGLYILYATKFNFSVTVIGAFLFFNLAGEKERANFYLLKEISSYKEKNKDIEKMPVKHLAVNKSFRIRKILTELSFSSYHIFTVVEEGRILATLTEGDLMEGLIKYGGKARICDIILENTSLI